MTEPDKQKVFDHAVAWRLDALPSEKRTPTQLKNVFAESYNEVLEAIVTSQIGVVLFNERPPIPRLEELLRHTRQA